MTSAGFTRRRPTGRSLALLVSLSLVFVVAGSARGEETEETETVIAVGSEQYQRFDRARGSETGPVELPRPVPGKLPRPNAAPQGASTGSATGRPSSAQGWFANTGGGLSSTSEAADQRSLDQVIRRLG